MAPVTFLYDLPYRVDIPHSVRTCGHTVPAPYTTVRVDINDSVRTFDGSVDRTDSDTDGFFTVITDDGKKKFLRIRIPSFLHLFYPVPPDSKRDIVFTLAGYGAGVAPDTLP